MSPPRLLLRYLAVPLQTAPLLVIVVFGLLLFLALKASLLGLWLGLLLLTGLFNYTFELLDSVVGGKEAPVLSVEMMNPVSAPRSLLMLTVVIVIFFTSQAGSYWFGALMAMAAATACAALLPAMLAVQSITGETLQALNLRTVFGLIARIGQDYLWVVVLVVVAGLLAMLSMSLSAVPLVLRLVVTLYLWLAAFSIIGGAIREHREDLDLESAWTPDSLEPAADADVQRERTRFVDRVYAQWRGGALTNAWESVTARAGSGPSALAEFEWMYERIVRWPDPRLANRLAREILPGLLAGRRNGEALDMTRTCLKADADFRPKLASELLTLATLARDAGDRPTARLLLRDFARFYPRDAAQSAAELLIQQLER